MKWSPLFQKVATARRWALGGVSVGGGLSSLGVQ